MCILVILIHMLLLLHLHGYRMLFPARIGHRGQPCSEIRGQHSGLLSRGAVGPLVIFHVLPGAKCIFELGSQKE